MFFHALVNFEILGYLAFRNMLFQASEKKTSKMHICVYCIALDPSASVNVNYISLSFFSTSVSLTKNNFSSFIFRRFLLRVLFIYQSD